MTAYEMRISDWSSDVCSSDLNPDLLLRPALDQGDERVPGDLVGETGAALADDAALAVEQDLGRDVDRLGKRPLHATVGREAGLGTPVGHRLVLQGALAAFVADRAVERVVDQQELHHPLLRLVGDRGGDLSVDHHAVGHGQGAGGLRLGHRAAVAGVGHLDHALPTGTHRGQQRVVAEPRDLGADLLGGTDHQGVLGDADLDAVDRDGDEIGLLRRRGHEVTSCSAHAVLRAGSNGQPPWVRWARYSSRKYWIDEVIGLVAPSPRAQKARPRMLSHWSRSSSRSSSAPWPFSSRVSAWTSHQVPSRHGVRSEERGGGRERVDTWRMMEAPYNKKKTKKREKK